MTTDELKEWMEGKFKNVEDILCEKEKLETIKHDTHEKRLDKLEMITANNSKTIQIGVGIAVSISFILSAVTILITVFSKGQ